MKEKVIIMFMHVSRKSVHLKGVKCHKIQIPKNREKEEKNKKMLLLKIYYYS